MEPNLPSHIPHEKEYTRVGEKPSGANKGYLAVSSSGQKVMLKATYIGYRPFKYKGMWTDEFSTHAEIVSSAITRRVLGALYAPKMAVVTKAKDSVIEKGKYLLLSEWIDTIHSVTSYQDYPILPDISKIITIAKLLRVVDFKYEHILMSQETGIHFLVDAGSYYIPRKTQADLLTITELFRNQHNAVTVHHIDTNEMFQTLKAFHDLSVEEIREIVGEHQFLISPARYEEVVAAIVQTQKRVTDLLPTAQKIKILYDNKLQPTLTKSEKKTIKQELTLEEIQMWKEIKKSTLCFQQRLAR